jgi:hypothetical protein
MPRKGFRTITVKESVYNYFYEQWLKQKIDLEIKGISTFSAFITYKLYQLLEQEKKQTQK